jgi:hypothetical protein
MKRAGERMYSKYIIIMRSLHAVPSVRKLTKSLKPVSTVKFLIFKWAIPVVLDINIKYR